MSDATTIRAWFQGRLPDGWFTEPVRVDVDREEILVVGTLSQPTLGPGGDDQATEVAHEARIRGHREDTREQRMTIASEAEARFRRKVSWGARCGGTELLFTTASVPVMTRLRMTERGVLDTLIDAGVARSRSEALNWCVRLVGQHQADWIAQLREAMQKVEAVRADGPTV